MEDKEEMIKLRENLENIIDNLLDKKIRMDNITATAIVDLRKPIYLFFEDLIRKLYRYKRLAEANLKDSEEFKDNMCKHRCILNNEVKELEEELDKKDKVIDEMLKFISEITDCPAENLNIDLNCAEECDCEKDRTKKCWKKYFFEKVEEEEK